MNVALLRDTEKKSLKKKMLLVMKVNTPSNEDAGIFEAHCGGTNTCTDWSEPTCLCFGSQKERRADLTCGLE